LARVGERHLEGSSRLRSVAQYPPPWPLVGRSNLE
jgi:hypothetical protein